MGWEDKDEDEKCLTKLYLELKNTGPKIHIKDLLYQGRIGLYSFSYMLHSKRR